MTWNTMLWRKRKEKCFRRFEKSSISRSWISSVKNSRLPRANDSARPAELKSSSCSQKGGYYGSIRKKGSAKSEASDARTEERHVEERALGKESHQPQTGDRHRFIGGSTRRREGTAAKKNQEKE